MTQQIQGLRRSPTNLNVTLIRVLYAYRGSEYLENLEKLQWEQQSIYYSQVGRSNRVGSNNCN